MSFFSKKIVGIDFNDYSAQLVEIKLANNELSLEAYNKMIIPPEIIHDGEILKENELRILMTSFLNGANPKPVETRDIAIVFPSSKVFTHIFTFPSNLKEAEIRQSLEFEAEKHIPFSIQDVYWDFTVLEKREPKSQYVLFAAIIKETADKYTSLFKSIDLLPSIFGITVEALAYGLLKQMEPGKTHLIISLDPLTTNYLVMRDGIIKHAFSSNKGGKTLIKELSAEFQVSEVTIIEQKDKELMDKRFLPSIEKFIQKTYKIGSKIIDEQSKRKDIGQINSVFLTGEFLNLPNFYETAQKSFANKTVQIGDPRKYLKVDDKKFRTLEKQSNSIPYSTYFTNSVGVAIRALLKKPKDGINLLPDEVKETASNKKYGLLVTFAAVFMCAVALFIATMIVFKHQEQVYTRTTLEIQKSAVDKLIYGTRYQEIRDEITKFNTEVREISEIDQSLFSMPVLIADIRELIPDGVTITNFKYLDSELIIELTGIADDRGTLLKMTQNFKEAEFISNVDIPISNYDEKTQISFEIKLELIFKELKKQNEAA